MTDSPYQSPPQAGRSADGSCDIAGDVRGLQIVTGALIMGVASFSAVALAITGGAVGTTLDFMNYLGVGFAALNFVLFLVVPLVMQKTQLAQISPQQLQDADEQTRCQLLLPVLRSSHIVGCAMLEGAAFFNVVIYFLTNAALSLAVAGLMALCLVVRFPTESRVRAWIRHTSENIQLK